MTTSDVKVSEGQGKQVATYSISEDSEKKQIQRVAINRSDGQELGTQSNPLFITLESFLSYLNDTIASYDTTDALMNGDTVLTPQFATIAVSTSGATSIVPGAINDLLDTTRIIRVLSLALVANGAVNVKFQSHVTPTDITGLFYLASNGGFVLPYNPKGWFQTIAGEALDINLSGNVAVGGCLTYVTV